jgi:hypothetical protein
MTALLKKKTRKSWHIILFIMQLKLDIFSRRINNISKQLTHRKKIMTVLSSILYGLYPIAKLVVFTLIALVGVIRISYEISLHLLKLLEKK